MTCKTDRIIMKVTRNIDKRMVPSSIAQRTNPLKSFCRDVTQEDIKKLNDRINAELQKNETKLVASYEVAARQIIK